VVDSTPPSVLESETSSRVPERGRRLSSTSPCPAKHPEQGAGIIAGSITDGFLFLDEFHPETGIDFFVRADTPGPGINGGGFHPLDIGFFE
jgi:hypothetical protein